MYKIEKKNFGVKITFEGFFRKNDILAWVNETKKVAPSLPQNFGVLVDMRTMKPLPRDAQDLMEEGQKIYSQNGMKRSVVVLNSATVTMQFKKIAKDTGIDKWERYIDASKTTNWEEVGINWLEKGVDPDKH